MRVPKNAITLFLIFFISLAVYALFTGGEFTTTNETSRIGTIQSLVARGIFELDTSLWYTNDKILINEKYYSDKLPTLSFLHAGVYGVMHALFAVDFAQNLTFSLRLFVFLVITGMSSLSLVFFYRLLRQRGCNEKVSMVMTFVLAFGTLFFPFSVVYNAHIVSAHLVIFSLYLLNKKEKGMKEIFLLGLLAGLNASVDLLAGGFFFLCTSAYFFFFSHQKAAGKKMYLIAACLSLGLYLLLNYQITGSFIPGAFQSPFFSYEGSTFSQKNLSGFYNHESFSQFILYALNMLIGARGLFLYSPIVLLAGAGLIAMWREKSERKLTLCLSLYILLVLFFSIFFSSDYSGDSFGVRWFVPLMPVLVYFTTHYYRKIYQKKESGKLAVFYIIATLSVLISLIGAFFPWSRDLFSLRWNLQYILSKYG